MNALVELKPEEYGPTRSAGETPVETLVNPKQMPFWSRFGVQIGALTLTLALGWGLGAYSFQHSENANTIQALQTQNQKLADLHAQLDGLHVKVEGLRQAKAQDIQALHSAVASIEKAIAAKGVEAEAANAKLTSALQKIEAMSNIDRTPVASVPKPEPAPLAKQTAKTDASARNDSLYSSFVLRQTYNGMALVEGRSGLEEVGPGDLLPGGARVEAIEKRGHEWVVVTNRGLIKGDAQTPQQ